MDGGAIVYCGGALGTPLGKTAHGLVRRTKRYDVLAVIDPGYAGKDAGEVLDGKPAGIPVHASLASALAGLPGGKRATHFVIGLAPDAGRLPPDGRAAVKDALNAGLDVDSGLHDFLSDDLEIASLARRLGRQLRDVRKTPPRSELHGFSGRIDQVGALRLAVLGTDSACGKRTTAHVLCDAMKKGGLTAEMIGTGQTAWLQGVEYGIILDSLINDFVAGELEHAVLRAWDEKKPDVIVVEGQGSLMNPAYPGGIEILAATRPHGIILQHAPTRKEYDGFPGFPLHPLKTQIAALELVSGRPVVLVTVNHEGMGRDDIPYACARLAEETGLPALDALVDGPERLWQALEPWIAKTR